MSINSKLNLYIPENLDIDYYLEKHPPVFRYIKDNFLFIIHLLTEIPAYDKDLLKGNGFIPIHAQSIQKFIRDYRLYLNYLIEQGIFQTDNYYIPGKKSRGYNFTPQFQTEVKVVICTNKKLIKKYNKRQENEHFSHHKYNYLKRWYNKDLKIDFNRALEEITATLKDNSVGNAENALLKFNASYLNICKFKEQNFYFKTDPTVNRLHTNLTALKSDLRKHLTYKGDSLVALDLSNSQPYLSTILLNPDFYRKAKVSPAKIGKLYFSSYSSSSPIMLVKLSELSVKEDIIKYKNLVAEGKLYEYLSIELNRKYGKTYSRKELKEIVFTILFTRNEYTGGDKRLFKNLFPDVTAVFEAIKEQNHTILPIMLQRMESTLFLDLICKRISKERPDCPIFTIHDSILTTVGNEEFVRQIMEEELTKAVEISPTIKIDYYPIEVFKKSA